ncbi:DUF6174 domain-containing protein [Simiduia agarivorans]|uniref:Uncharacterized protein n=1 Tax=Simiduia agarivorans (strain DSM 21679 / JCM 13881 / BCRC 17597 / SA1) TaxID=1117647 RepID=R9S5E3_SIMAS|nr:DUF6174 domain-containing protein [Simiduia agarivorans]AGN11351.1 hypothetical protein M5M_13469 [Simiduia agarivorans SA1 = DSM 21679]
MKELKAYISIVGASVVCVVFVYVFFGIYLQYDAQKKSQEVDASIDLWLKNKPERYSYTIREGCMLYDSYQVIHLGNEVKYFDLQKKEYPFDYMQIIDVFERLKKAKSEANTLEVEYHPLGFPKSIKVDWDYETYDDECFIIVEDFQQI